MEREMLAYFDNMLKELLQEAMPTIRTLLAYLEENGNFHGPMDDVDLTTMRYEQQWVIQTQQRRREHARQIVQALKRIKEGKFGICEGCGWDIEINRLKVQPTATLCIICMKESESLVSQHKFTENMLPLR